MHCISVSYHTTSSKIRQKFAFTKSQQIGCLQYLTEEQLIDGGMILSTCNRSEVYIQPSVSDQETLTRILEGIAGYKKIPCQELLAHGTLYQEKEAVRHLFQVVSGMDSMILGEDEILHQTKEAYQWAKEHGFLDGTMHILLQGAFHCAKTIKNNTFLSRTPVSIGTLTALQVCDTMEKWNVKDPYILLIGASGKIGSIIGKNLADKGFAIHATRRTCWNQKNLPMEDQFLMVDYELRYQALEFADVIISATASPHFVFTREGCLNSSLSPKKRLLIDCAMPYDLDDKIATLPGMQLYDIDYFQQLAQDNNQRKQKELQVARALLDEEVEEVQKKLCLWEFHKEPPHIVEAFLQKMLHLKNQLSSEEYQEVLEGIRSNQRGEGIHGLFSIYG